MMRRIATLLLLTLGAHSAQLRSGKRRAAALGRAHRRRLHASDRSGALQGRNPRVVFLETIDLAPDRGRSEPEWNFGLLRNDFSPKPEYTALKNLLAAIGTGAPAALEPLKLSIESGPDDFRTLVLQRADGSYLIALWRLTSVWDRHASTPIAVPPQRVKLSLPDARSVGAIAPMASTSKTALPLSHSRVVVDVAGDPLVLRVVT
jgi:hypothetical protein